MARLARLTVADYPHHVIQRGNNRQSIFLDDADRRFMLDLLLEKASALGVAIHAYVLMDNHFHLLATPRDSDGLPKMMQGVGRQYVRYFNKRYRRSGTLWEGRYRSNLIDSEAYLLTCMAYIELNPVRAGMVERAQDFPWSSHAHYAGTRADRLLSPPSTYWSLGNTPFAREAAYIEFVNAGVKPEQQKALTDSALHGWALGGAGFMQNLQKLTSRRINIAHAGRPKNKTGAQQIKVTVKNQ